VVRVDATTETGRVRRRNEDGLLVDVDRHLLVVADGMGGHPAGDVASQLAIDAVNDGLDPAALDDGSRRPEALREAVTRAHEAIIRAAEDDPSRAGMGTTLVVAHVDEGGELVTLAHVGDSRAYLLRDGELRPLTYDHASHGGFGHRRLTQALGASPRVDPEVSEVPVRPGDRLLLCTDGLTDELREEEIVQLAEPPRAPDEAVQALVEAALEAGGDDNITVVVAEVGGSD
jgi:PPM family protein phosphatase